MVVNCFELRTYISINMSTVYTDAIPRSYWIHVRPHQDSICSCWLCSCCFSMDNHCGVTKYTHNSVDLDSKTGLQAIAQSLHLFASTSMRSVHQGTAWQA